MSITGYVVVSLVPKNPAVALRLLDEWTTELAAELSSALRVRTGTIERPVLPGARAGGLPELGTFVLAGLSGGAAKALLEIVRTWLEARGTQRPQVSIVLTGANGVRVEITGDSLAPDEVVRLAEQLQIALAAPALTQPGSSRLAS